MGTDAFFTCRARIASLTAARCHPASRSYEHTNAICNLLNGVPPPKLSPELEERLKAMFTEIQEPFERHCPPNRKNFLSCESCALGVAQVESTEI